MALALSMTAISVYADFEEDVVGRTTKVGEPINFCEDIVPETQWYVIQTLYSGADAAYLWDYHSEYVYTSVNGTDDVVDGLDPTTIEDLLVHFVPATVSSADYDTYYIQFANDDYIWIKAQDIVSYKYCYVSSTFSNASAFNVYNTGGEAGHFGFYTADSYGSHVSLYSWAGKDGNVYPWDAGGAQSTTDWIYDFAIIPVDMVLPDMDDHELALTECQLAYTKYVRYVGTFTTGTDPGCYGEAEVAAFEAAVTAAEGCDSEDTDALTIEQLTQWKEDMESTYQAVQDSYVAYVNVADGYYRIEVGGYDFLFEPAMYVVTDEDLVCSTYWGALQDDVHYLWKLTGKGDNAYDVRNVSNNATFDDLVLNSQATLSEASENLMVFDYSKTNDAGEYLFFMRTSTAPKNGDTYLWPADTSSGDGTGSTVSAWYGNRTSALWKLVPVSDEDAQAIIDAYDYDQQARYFSTRTIIMDAQDKMDIAYDSGGETSQAAVLGDIYTNLSSAVSAAEAEGEQVTEETYNTLSAAYEAFIAVFVDPTGMRDALDDASSYVERVVTGTNPGMWSDASAADELNATITAATAYDAAGKYTTEETDSYTETLVNQLASLKASVISVQSDKWYEIRFATEEETNEHGWSNSGAATSGYPERYGKYISVCDLVTDASGDYAMQSLTSKQADEEAFFGHNLYFEDKATMEDEDFAKFRFINVGDSAYMIQNKATGLFLRSIGTSADCVVLDLHPTLFTVTPLGYGESLFSSETLDGESHNYLYGWYYQNSLITWTSHSVGSAAGFFIEDVDEAISSDLDEATEFNMGVVVGQLYTFCYPVPLTASDGIMYAVTVDGSTATLSPLAGNTARAGQPFAYIEGDIEDYDADEPEDEVVVLSHGYDVQKEAQTSGALVGTYEAGSVTLGSAVPSGNAFAVVQSLRLAVDANSAYISGLLTTNDLAIVISEEEVDNIQKAVASVSKQDGRIYSIDGKFIGSGNVQTVRSLPRGIYIINGVKVVVK